MRSAWFVVLAILLAGCQAAPSGGGDSETGTATTTTTTAASTTTAPCVPTYAEARWRDSGLVERLLEAEAQGWTVDTTVPEGHLMLPAADANASLVAAAGTQVFFGPFGGAGVLPNMGVFLEPGPMLVAIIPDHSFESSTQSRARVSPLLHKFLENTTDYDGSERGSLVFTITNAPQPGPTIDGQRTAAYRLALNATPLALDRWYAAWHNESAPAGSWEGAAGNTWQFARRAGDEPGFQVDREAPTPVVWGGRWVRIEAEAEHADGALLRAVSAEPDEALYVAATAQPSETALRETLRQHYHALDLGLLPRDVTFYPDGCPA